MRVTLLPLRVRLPYRSTAPASTLSKPVPRRVSSAGCAVPSTSCQMSPSAPEVSWRSPSDCPSETVEASSATRALPARSIKGASRRMPRAKSSVDEPRNSMRFSDWSRSLSNPLAISVSTLTVASAYPSSLGTRSRPEVTTMRRSSGSVACPSGRFSSREKLPPAAAGDPPRPRKTPSSAAVPCAFSDNAPAWPSRVWRSMDGRSPLVGVSTVWLIALTSMRAPDSTTRPAFRASMETVPPLTSVPCTRPRSLGVGTNVPAVEMAAREPMSRSGVVSSVGPDNVRLTLPPGALMRPSTDRPFTADSDTSPRGSVLIEAPSFIVSTAAPGCPP